MTVWSRWSRACPPEDGELLSSALIRNAHAHSLPAWHFCNLYWPGNGVWTRDLDRHVTDDLIADWSARGEVPVSRLIAASLRPEIEVLGAVGAVAPWIMAAGIRNISRRLHHLGCCPDCLSERQGVWLKAWRYAFAIGCTRHGRRLIDACPRCDAILAPHRSQALRKDRCDACGASLLEAPMERVDPTALALQERLLELLQREIDHRRHGGGRSLSGDASAPELRDWRTMIGVVSAPAVRAALARVLGVVIAAADAGGIRRIEFARIAWRHETMLLVSQWCQDWPEGFIRAAREAGVTQRAFARSVHGPVMARALEQLRPRYRSHRTKPPLIHTCVVRRLRKNDPEGYREARAARIARAASRQLQKEVAQ